jgi:hypothetical protein
LVLPWNIGFDERYIAPILSHQSRALFGDDINSLSIVWIHMISTLTLVALYSASVLDLEIVGCFFADHEIRLGPKKTHYLFAAALAMPCTIQGENHELVLLLGFSLEIYEISINNILDILCEKD